MKFKASPFEKNCNEYWNIEVVTSYNKIKGYSESRDPKFFSITRPSIESLVNQYCYGVMNIVNNLARQMEARMYEDTDAVTTYLAQVYADATADIELFRMELSSFDIKDIINKTVGVLAEKCPKPVLETGSAATQLSPEVLPVVGLTQL